MTFSRMNPPFAGKESGDRMVVHAQGAYPFLRLEDGKLLRGCWVDPYQASGPGGQKRNRTYSAVRILHLETGLSTIAEESRSQIENRAKALRRLRVLVALNVRPGYPPERFEIVEEVKGFLRSNPPLRINTKNPFYPFVCATMSDAVYFQKGKIGEAATMLGVSAGQMLRVMSKDRQLLTAINQMRSQFGLKPVRSSR